MLAVLWKDVACVGLIVFCLFGRLILLEALWDLLRCDVCFLGRFSWLRILHISSETIYACVALTLHRMEDSTVWFGYVFTIGSSLPRVG